MPTRIAAAAAVLLTASGLSAQCVPTWSGLGPGLQPSVFTSTSWDPDGSGPLGAMLVAGGSFMIPGQPGTQGVASWTGGTWTAVGQLAPNVYDLITYQGSLVAGGVFPNAVVRWDGNAWQPIGTGLSSSVLALTEFHSQLFAGGFVHLGGNPEYLVRWDGATWRTVGMIGPVLSLAVFRDELVVGGSFTVAGGLPASNIARWDGVSWHAFPADPDSTVRAMTVIDDRLIAAGDFEHIGVQALSHIAAWDGAAWHPLAAGLDQTPHELAV